MVLVHQKWDKIEELLFEHPDERFTVRKISRRTKIPASSVQRYLTELRKGSFITKENKLISSNHARFNKAFLIMDKLFTTGLMDYLDKTLAPSAVIVFGSVRKGEYDSQSDIDLFVESTKKQNIELSSFEKKIGHSIQLFIEKDINSLPPELLNSVINGIKLKGYFKIK